MLTWAFSVGLHVHVWSTWMKVHVGEWKSAHYPPVKVGIMLSRPLMAGILPCTFPLIIKHTTLTPYCTEIPFIITYTIPSFELAGLHWTVRPEVGVDGSTCWPKYWPSSQEGKIQVITNYNGWTACNRPASQSLL